VPKFVKTPNSDGDETEQSALMSNRHQPKITSVARTFFVCLAILVGPSRSGAVEGPSGFIEVCGAPDIIAPTTRLFRVNVSGVEKEFVFPGDACTAPIQVRAGDVKVVEVAEDGVEVTRIEAFSLDDTGTRVSREVSKSPVARTVYASVLAGDVSKQTVIVFTNRRSR
jgi:hypothetical protein